MKSRNEAPTLFSRFKTTAENFCGKKIKFLHVDNAPELIHGQMKSLCDSHGISFEKTVPDSPAQNGVAERTNLTVCSMARAMLIDANLRDFFWPFALLAAVHIKQRVPHSSLPTGVTPFHLWFGHRPNLSHLRPFGTKFTARILSTNLSKFHPRGESGRFLGYATDSKGYLVWVPNEPGSGGSVKIRRDVVFHDFPDPPRSADPPSSFLPLWEDVHFPSRVEPHHTDGVDLFPTQERVTVPLYVPDLLIVPHSIFFFNKNIILFVVSVDRRGLVLRPPTLYETVLQREALNPSHL